MVLLLFILRIDVFRILCVCVLIIMCMNFWFLFFFIVWLMCVIGWLLISNLWLDCFVFVSDMLMCVSGGLMYMVYVWMWFVILCGLLLSRLVVMIL